MSKGKFIRKSDFFSKYKHPHWQKRRLEIMQLQKFQCESCGDKESTLNVHHKFYVAGRDPWEYQDDELVCLCESCHQSAHKEEERLKESISDFKKYGMESISRLIGYIDGRNGISYHCSRCIPTDDFWEYIYGFADAAGWETNLLYQLEEKILQIYLAMGFIDHEAIGFLFESETMSQTRAEYLRIHSPEFIDLYPEWLKLIVFSKIDEAFKNASKAEK